MILSRLLDVVRAQPAVVIAAAASIMLTVQQALDGELTWTAALPLVLGILIRSVVTPAYGGWVSRHGVLLGVIGSCVVIVGQLADGTVTTQAAWPLLLGVLVKASGAPPAPPVVPFGGTTGLTGV